MHYVYILNCDNAFFYIGITDNLELRIKQHKQGFSPHTKRYIELELVYFEQHETQKGAEHREKQLKGWTRAKKKALIDGDFEELKKLSKSKF